MLRDWAAIPTAVFISEKLANDADYATFRSVCNSWRSAAPKRPQLPWLVLEYRDEHGSRVLGLCNYPNTTDLQLTFNPKPPEGISPWEIFGGSSHGWIALLDDAPGISLYNPFTEAHTRLPRLDNLPEFCRGFRIKKSDEGFAIYTPDGTRVRTDPFRLCGTILANHVVMSADPSDENCVVMAISYNGERLIYCRPGDGSWTPLSPPSRLDFYQDITFYKGQFYAVSKYRLFVCDTGPASLVTQIWPAYPLFYPVVSQDQPQRHGFLRSYLVVSSGDLLLATIRDQSSYLNRDAGYHCEVFRVDLDDGQLKLFKLENLGGRSLFLGQASMSVSSGNSPSCKGNCIYFCEKSSVREPDSNPSCPRMLDRVAVHDMEDGSTSFTTSLSADCSGAHWITPNLNY